MNVYFLLGILLFCCCNNPEKNVVVKVEDSSQVINYQEKIRDSIMIPDTLFSPKAGDNIFREDIITDNGNFIHYKITNDTLCSDNVYIEWGNKNFKRIHICPTVRQFRTYFIPVFVSETDKYLIFEYGSATSCRAVLFLPLNKTESVKDFTGIIGYSESEYIVVRQNEIYEGDENEKDFLEAVNIRTNKSKRIAFKNSAIAGERHLLIDSCSISRDSIYLSADLYDRLHDKEVKEIVRIKNDLK